MPTTASITDIRQARQQLEVERFEAYQVWERHQLEDPRLASLRMLCDDIRELGGITDETRQRFDDEETTWAAEVLDAPQYHVDRFRFDGADIIVKESDGVQPRITLRGIYENGFEKTKRDVESEPGLIFQLKRDQYFMEFLETIEAMMRKEIPYDTIHMRSTCPVPHEIANDPTEALRLLKLRHYNIERGKSFDYTARRLPNGELELSVTALDNSDLEAHQAVLRADGYQDFDFSAITSHEYGQLLGFANTTDKPIQIVSAERAALYDTALMQKTGNRYSYGRNDGTIEAHTFLSEYCQDHMAGYKAYHELLAQHIEGGPLSPQLQNYLLRCIEGQAAEGKTVLSSREQLNRLRAQLHLGKLTRDMAMSCRELLIYDHHASITKLLKQYKDTGGVESMGWDGEGDFLDAYASSASANGVEAAANGETFDGCETGVGVQSLEAAAQLASEQDISLEEALRLIRPERKWQKGDCRVCLAKDTKVGECFVCKRCENAHNRGGDKALEAIMRQVTKAEDDTTFKASPDEYKEQFRGARLQNGKIYRFGKNVVEYRVEVTVGGAESKFITNDGYEITGRDAELMRESLELAA